MVSAGAALPALAGDINFSSSITPAEFQKFSRIVAQGIFASPVQPARASGIAGFDIGIAATFVAVDENASYYRHAVSSSITTHGYLGVPRLVIAKGFGAGTISGTYAKISNSGAKTYGGALDLPLLRGSTVAPELGLRASYARITGISALRLKTYGAEAFISKGIGPFTPYGAIGRMWSDGQGAIAATTTTQAFTISDKSNINRYTAGVRFSLFLPKISIEATQAEVRTYAAKVSIGF